MHAHPEELKIPGCRASAFASERERRPGLGWKPTEDRPEQARSRGRVGTKGHRRDQGLEPTHRMRYGEEIGRHGPRMHARASGDKARQASFRAWLLQRFSLGLLLNRFMYAAWSRFRLCESLCAVVPSTLSHVDCILTIPLERTSWERMEAYLQVPRNSAVFRAGFARPEPASREMSESRGSSSVNG
eukprot:scaffold4023_cov31-Tisochrysis_lutea.AAC.3